jgi:hypothetical protein
MNEFCIRKHNNNIIMRYIIAYNNEITKYSTRSWAMCTSFDNSFIGLSVKVQ